MDCHQCRAFNKLYGVQIKSGAFFNNFSIVETFVINTGFWRDKSTDSSTVYSKNYIL